MAICIVEWFYSMPFLSISILIYLTFHTLVEWCKLYTGTLYTGTLVQGIVETVHFQCLTEIKLEVPCFPHSSHNLLLTLFQLKIYVFWFNAISFKFCLHASVASLSCLDI